MDPRLLELRTQIAREARFVGTKPFSHNIINLALAEIGETFGRMAANKAVRDFRLKAKGWHEESEDTDE
jgi:hypothetical protein